MCSLRLPLPRFNLIAPSGIFFHSDPNGSSSICVIRWVLSLRRVLQHQGSDFPVLPARVGCGDPGQRRRSLFCLLQLLQCQEGLVSSSLLDVCCFFVQKIIGFFFFFSFLSRQDSSGEEERQEVEGAGELQEGAEGRKGEAGC